MLKINPDILGRNLRALRKARQLTVNRLAALSGIAASGISRYERGQILPSLEGFFRLTVVLLCGPADLLEGALIYPDPDPEPTIARAA